MNTKIINKPDENSQKGIDQINLLEYYFTDRRFDLYGELDYLLKRVISRIPKGKTALFLSGGLDSSILSSYVDCPAITYDGEELSHAKLQADFVGKKLLVTKIKNPTETLHHLTKISNEPVRFRGAIPFYEMCKFSKEKGYDTIITGEGGDELFWGYEFFPRTLEYINNSKYANFTENEIIYYGGGIDKLELIEKLTGNDRSSLKNTIPFRWLENCKLETREKMIQYRMKFRLPFLIRRLEPIEKELRIKIVMPFFEQEIVDFANSIDIDLRCKERKYILRKFAEGRVEPRLININKLGSPFEYELPAGDENFEWQKHTLEIWKKFQNSNMI